MYKAYKVYKTIAKPLALLALFFIHFQKQVYKICRKRIKKELKMKIKLFYQKYKQSLEDFESQVNGFMAGVEVIDVKYTEATSGDYENLDTIIGVLVL